MKRFEKVYAAEFRSYTNCLKDTVSDHDEAKGITNSTRYLTVGFEPFLIKESDIPKYQCFGGGYRSLVFVGNMEVEEKDCPHFHTVDMSIDDLLCSCDVNGMECDACDEDFCFLRCPKGEVR